MSPSTCAGVIQSVSLLHRSFSAARRRQGLDDGLYLPRPSGSLLDIRVHGDGFEHATTTAPRGSGRERQRARYEAPSAAQHADRGGHSGAIDTRSGGKRMTRSDRNRSCVGSEATLGENHVGTNGGHHARRLSPADGSSVVGEREVLRGSSRETRGPETAHGAAARQLLACTLSSEPLEVGPSHRLSGSLDRLRERKEQHEEMPASEWRGLGRRRPAGGRGPLAPSAAS